MERSSDKRAWQAVLPGGASAGILAAGGVGTSIVEALHPYGHAANPAIIIPCALASTIGAVIVAVVKTRSERPADSVYAEIQGKIAAKITDPERALELVNQSAAINRGQRAPTVPAKFEEQLQQIINGNAQAPDQPAKRSHVSPG